MYDVYLKATLLQAPEISDLVQAVPSLIDPALQRRIVSRSCVPGALGLELSKEMARRLLERFIAAGSEGYYFPASYHHPPLSSEEALSIATDAIEKEHSMYDPTDTIGPVFFHDDYPCYWEFGAHSERMTKEGRVPNGHFVLVDKLDGHLWQNEELTRLVKGERF
ncbi:MAG TPA: hypothetical protein VL485_01010 [Ktedonobacteraceae bacterium]|nr:hypothetical protein [Ktedonobacteraceae bacterium]